MAREIDWANIVEMETKEIIETTKKNQPFDIQMVSVYDLDQHDQNDFPMTEIEKLAAIIQKSGGMNKPVTVTPKDGGRYKVIAGNRRVEAVLLLQKQNADISPMIPAIIATFQSQAEELESVYFDNLASREMSQRDLGIAYQRLEPLARELYNKARKNKTYKGPFRTFFAEEYLHIPETTLHRRLNLSKIELSIVEQIERGEISETAVSMIAAYSHPEQIEIIEKVRENLEKGGKITVKAIETYLKRKKLIETVVVQTTEAKLPEIVPIQAPIVDQPVAPVQAPVAEQPEAAPVQAPVDDQPEATSVQAPVAEQPEADPVQAPVAEQPEADPVQAPVAEQPEADPVQAPVAEQPEGDPVQAPVAEQPEVAPVQAPIAEQSEAVSALESEYTKIPIQGKISSIGMTKENPTLTREGVEYVKNLLSRKIEILDGNPDCVSRVYALKVFRKKALEELEKLQ